MKKPSLILLMSAVVCTLTILLIARSRAESTSVAPIAEFATIRWDGKDNTHVIRPDGKLERFKSVFSQVGRPSGADERTFYLNIAMNALAEEGFEFARMNEDEIVMRRGGRAGGSSQWTQQLE